MSTPHVLGPGTTALVTGASRGIGALIAREIASHGGHVVLSGRSVADLEAVASDLTAAGADVSFLPADLTEPGAAQALVRTVERQRGGVDLLVNNAGGDPLREFHTMTIEENLRTLRLNLVAPLELSYAVLPGMLSRGRGHIVNISAMAGRLAFPYTEVYAAAKDGLIGFTRVFRSDYHARGVSASVLILGAIKGELRTGPADDGSGRAEGRRLHGPGPVRGAGRGPGPCRRTGPSWSSCPGPGPPGEGGHGLLPCAGTRDEPGGRDQGDHAEDHRTAGLGYGRRSDGHRPRWPSPGRRRCTAGWSQMADGGDLDAPITGVTVFRDGARVQRTGTVSLPPGPRTVIVSDLPAGVDPASVRVAARGPGLARLAVEVHRRYRTDPLREETCAALRLGGGPAARTMRECRPLDDERRPRSRRAWTSPATCPRQRPRRWPARSASAAPATMTWPRWPGTCPPIPRQGATLGRRREISARRRMGRSAGNSSSGRGSAW